MQGNKTLALVHSDLTGSIQPLAKEGYKYVINFIDDYSGLPMLCFLKHKSDTLLATKKYLADITPYGRVKCLQTDNGTEFTLELFQQLYITESDMSSQLLIFALKRNCWTVVVNLIFYGKVSLYGVKIAHKLVG